MNAEAKHLEDRLEALNVALASKDPAAIEEAVEDVSFTAGHTDDGQLRDQAHRRLMSLATHPLAGPVAQKKLLWIQEALSSSEA